MNEETNDVVLANLHRRLPPSLLYTVLAFAPRGLDRHALARASACFHMGLFLRRIGCAHLRRPVCARIPRIAPVPQEYTVDFHDDSVWFTATFVCRPRARCFRVTDYVVIQYA